MAPDGWQQRPPVRFARLTGWRTSVRYCTRDWINTLTKVEVLVVDDFVMNPLDDIERRLFLQICVDPLPGVARPC
jgi:DNA replication protein DnaC